MPATSNKAIKAGEAFVELFADDSQFSQTLNRAKVKFTSFVGLIKTAGLGNIIKQFGVGGLIGAFGVSLKSLGTQITALGKRSALMGGSIALAFGIVTVASVKYLNQVNRMAMRTDSTTESVSRLAYALEQVGVELDDMQDIQEDLRERTLKGAMGAVDQANALKQMGVSAQTFTKLNIDEKMLLIAETFEKLNTPLEKTNFLLALFGDSSASRVLPLLVKGSKELRESYARAGNVGRIVSTEDAKKATQALHNLNMVLDSIKTTLLEVGIAVLTLGDDSGETLQIIMNYLKMARDWIKENRRLVAAIVIIGVVLLAVGLVLIAVGSLFTALGATIAGVMTTIMALGPIIAAIGVPLIVVVAILAVVATAIIGIGYLLVKYTDIGKKFAEVWSAGFRDIRRTFELLFRGMFGAFKHGDFNLMGQIFVTSFAIAMTQLQLSAMKTWNELMNYLVDRVKDAASTILYVFNSMGVRIHSWMLQLVRGLVSAALFVVEKIDKAIPGEGLKAQIDELKQAQAELDTRIAQREKEKLTIKDEANRDVENWDANRKARQIHQVGNVQDEINRMMKVLEALVEKAERPIELPEPAKQPVPNFLMRQQPMMGLDMRVSQLGDSVRGLFDSADFRGALGIGPANSYAKQSVDLQQKMFLELQKIRAGVDGANVFV